MKISKEKSLQSKCVKKKKLHSDALLIELKLLLVYF